MDIATYPICIYCLIDDWLKGRWLRQRGARSRLSTSEVLTMKVVSEFPGIDRDQGLYTFFSWFFGDWFPGSGPG